MRQPPWDDEDLESAFTAGYNRGVQDSEGWATGPDPEFTTWLARFHREDE